MVDEKKKPDESKKATGPKKGLTQAKLEGLDKKPPVKPPVVVKKKISPNPVMVVEYHINEPKAPVTVTFYNSKKRSTFVKMYQRMWKYINRPFRALDVKHEKVVLHQAPSATRERSNVAASGK